MANTILIIFLLCMNIYTIYCIHMQKKESETITETQIETMHLIKEKHKVEDILERLMEENEVLRSCNIDSGGGFYE